MESIPSPQSFIFSDDYICQWDSCLKNFDDAEMLYEHLRDDHVGRKAHHNLCLKCHWDKCNVPEFSKRDHITSHLRVHVASKPYRCEICRKGFKRPQDLKKHEKTHQENAFAGSGTPAPNGVNGTGAGLRSYDQYQPLTPPSYIDRSPSIPASVLSSERSPHVTPLSPASTDDLHDPLIHSVLSPSEGYGSPCFTDPDVDVINQSFARPPAIDVTGAYFGAFPTINPTYDDIVSPLSAKRPRDNMDDLFEDTLGSLAMEAKKKRLGPSYSEDMMGRLNAIQALLDVNPLTPDRLVTSLPDVNDWNQFNQFNQFCSALFEDVSGQVFEPQTQTLGTLFPDFDQKQIPASLGAGYSGVSGLQPFSTLTATSSAMGSSNIGYDTSTPSPGESIYSAVLGDDPFVMGSTPTTTPLNFASQHLGGWDGNNRGVVMQLPPKNLVETPAPDNPSQYGFITPLQNHNVRSVKLEIKEEERPRPKLEIEFVREFKDMGTQTKAKQERYNADGTKIRMRPEEKKKYSTDLDSEAILMSAPAVPDMPLPELDITEDELEKEEEERQSSQDITQQQSDDTTQQPRSSRFEDIIRKERAKQAAAAAAAATASSTEALDPVGELTRQLDQTHLETPTVHVVTTPSTVRPVVEGDMERQIKAAKARSMCAQDPVRKQHAEVVLNLLQSMDELMALHRQKVTEWKLAQISQHQSGGSGPHISASTAGATYERKGGVHIHKQGQIRTVSSYLPRRTGSHQPSPLHQEFGVADPAYSQLRSSLSNEPSIGISRVAVTDPSDSPVLYPTRDLHKNEDVPFVLLEEERRFIEEDIARSAAQTSAPYSHA